MLSYQHGYHAGNHADVLKHLVLCRVLAHLNQKPRGWLFLDTHAGAGAYDLQDAFALKTGEADTGIHRLRAAAEPPAVIAEYLAHTANAHGHYPGSPRIAAALARPDDLLVFCERHPGEFLKLQALFAARTGKVRCIQGDGYAAVKYTLPPPTRRGAILIDPAYELRDDWSLVEKTLAAGLRRFATGTWMIWYPRLHGGEEQGFINRLRLASDRAWLHATLDIARPGSRNCHGSGMFVVNPPYTLAADLANCLPFLADTLGIGGSGRSGLESGG